jgi:signal transduction histidine kinase
MGRHVSGYHHHVGHDLEHARRTDRTLVALRALVAGLALLHVALIASQLESAGLLVGAVVASVLLIVSCAWSARRMLRRETPSAAAADWCIAALDAVALVTISRLTVAVDPEATIAWSFVLWVPFSVGVRARIRASMAASLGTAALVLVASQVGSGSLEPLPLEWSSVGVPVALVLVAGLVTTLAAVSQRRSGVQVRQELDDERDRAIRLREADDLKNTFLAAVSHELRTPLTSILGFAVTMLDRPEIEEAQRQRMLRMVVSEAEHLEDILANLLDLDRLTRGKANLVPVDVDPATIVRTAVEHVEQRSGRVVAVEAEPGLRMLLDAAKVERIVENLVGNAVKYTPDDAQVHVAVRADGSGLLIRVDDTGPGITRELRETIFEPFRRGADIGVPGTGIGLSLVDRFSRMHGGRAWVEDRPGGGCRFQVYLQPQPAPPPRTTSGGGAYLGRISSASPASH